MDNSLAIYNKSKYYAPEIVESIHEWILNIFGVFYSVLRKILKLDLCYL